MNRHKHCVQLDFEQATKLLEAWRADYDDEGYNFPFFETWVIVKQKATSGRIDKNAKKPVTVFFGDDQAAVEFKLKWS